MINYSINMRLNPQKREEPEKAYGVAQYTEKMSLEEFAEHISSHNSVYDKADIQAVLTKAVQCMREQLIEGKKIELGDLGEFYVTLNSVGVDAPEDYNPAIHVKKVNVNWTPGAKFEDLLDYVTFNLVPSREAAKNVNAAIKKGEDTVTLKKAAVNPDTSAGGDSTGGSSTDTGGSQGSTDDTQGTGSENQGGDGSLV